MKEKLIVQIVCDKEVGTAFYVAPDLLLTAYHTVVSFKDTGRNIVKDSIEGDLKFEIIDIIESADIAILKVERQALHQCLPLLSYRFRIGEDFESYGYPDKASIQGLRIEGQVNQKKFDSTADYVLFVRDADATCDYEGMSGAPVLFDDTVVGVVIEQSGNCLNMVSIQKIREELENNGIVVENETSQTELPASIAKDVEASCPNYEMFDALDARLEAGNKGWLLVYGNPGCGKTTLSASYEPNNDAWEVIGRFFFKVPNDQTSRAVRCSQSFFIDWLESVYISITNADIRKLSPEEKKNSIPQWFLGISDLLSQEGKQGILIIDGLDELATDAGNKVDDFLSLIPETQHKNIRIVLSCITESILPPNVIEKISNEDKIEVTPLNMAACESYIHDNSGDWEKPYSFIQAVANKTEGHPLYMNYLCRYISDAFDATTKEGELNEWVDNLPSIGGDIRSYYEAVWKKTDSNSGVIEILALLSQTRGPIEENQLIGMTRDHDPFRFKSYTKDFRHLMKEQNSDIYEIYHSSFRLFVTEKLSSIIQYTNDQIANYCSLNKNTIYSIENYLHHIVNGSDAKQGLLMCNQEWADNCAMRDVSPDLIMHDIKECLSVAVDLSLPIEVIRLMLLAQRIENRCDSIMVENVEAFVNLNIALGKPDVAMKYIVRDNILLVDLPNAITYLQVLFELGYKEQAITLSEVIDATIRKTIEDNSRKGINSFTFAARGMALIERMQAGIDDMTYLENFYKYVAQLLRKGDDDTRKWMLSVRDMVTPYHMSGKLRLGTKIDIAKYLKMLKTGWGKDVVMLFAKSLLSYDQKETRFHIVGHNEAYMDCLRQIEDALDVYSFEFSKDELKLILYILLHQSNRVDIIEMLLTEYKPNPGQFAFRADNGVDVDEKSLLYYYQETLYSAYFDKCNTCPPLNQDYYGDKSWEQYIEALITRIAYVNGQLYRKKALGEGNQAYYVFVKEVLDSIRFSFVDRIKWQRSYLLPESLFPFIYERLLEIYCDFYEAKIGDFVDHLKSRMSDQLCLYREGYCASLIRMIDVLITKGKHCDVALFLADEGVKYILYAIQNRSERCKSLMEICLDYALFGEKCKVEMVYQEVLNSSMGPDWYKEAQLELINIFRESDIKFDAGQVAHMAAIFEEASGEMTFQRYVQQEKDEFVATIARASSLSDAIAYYKFETLPTAERIVQNAEEWKVDMPQKGDGYDLGANHLIEASAICQLLTECRNVSPYIRYAISELFWDNWDKLHNDYHYAQLHSEIIATLGERDSRDVLIPRMAEYIANEYNHDKSGSYLSDFDKSRTTETIIKELEERLKERKFSWKRGQKATNSNEHKEGGDDIMNNMFSCKDILDKNRKEIVSPIGSYWYSLSDFLKPLVNMPDFDRESLFGVISGHYDINVQPSELQFEKFEWFTGAHEENDADEQMIHFLIWFLLHPDRMIAVRAYNSLMWLEKYDGRVVDCLIAEILNPSEVGLATAASSVLLEIANSHPDKVLTYMREGNLQNQLSLIPNFSVSRNLFEIARLFLEKFGYDDFLNIMHPIIPDELPDRGDVMIDFKDMMFIEHKIDKLNNLQVTGGKEFAKPYLEKIKEMQLNGIVDLLIRSDIYTRRSFYLKGAPIGRYCRAMEDVLNEVLYGKVDNKRASRVYYAIND